MSVSSKRPLIFLGVCFVVGVAVVIFLSFAYPFGKSNVRDGSATTEPNIVSIRLNEAIIQAEVMRTQDELRQGLSGRETLSEQNGMWFDFGAPGRWGIWMKDMKFPIDIIWVDEKMQIADIKTDISPETYPEIFLPVRNASFVLEVPAGTVEKYALGVGNQVFVR